MDQLQPEDTLIDRGVDDILDEGVSPLEKPLGWSRRTRTAACPVARPRPKEAAVHIVDEP